MDACLKTHLEGSFVYNLMGGALYDDEGRLIDVNESVTGRYSISGSDILKKNLFEADYLSDKQKESLKFGRVVNNSIPLGFTIVPFGDVDGNRVGYTLLLTDTSGIRKLTENIESEPQKMENALFKLEKSLLDTVLFVNEDLLIERVINNDKENGITSDAVNFHVDRIPGFQYSDRKRARIEKILYTCIKEEKMKDVEFSLRKNNGSVFYFKARIIPVHGKQIIVSLRNQTRLVELEKENNRLSARFSEQNNMMELALQKSNVTVYSFSFERFKACDKKHCQRCFQFYGATNELLDRNKYICRALTVLRHPEDRNDFFLLFNNIRTRNPEEEKMSFRLKNNEGIYRSYEVCGKTQEYDKEGHPNLIIGTITDNQEQMEYERSLIEAKEKAETADRLKTTFLANMTHEIRTPLHAIVGFSELLRAEEDQGMREEYMNVIKANNEQLMRLVNDVLDVSKIEANMITFSYVPLSIPLWMQEVYNTISLRVPKEVELIMDSCPDITLETDKSRITQVLTNLLTNAIKHTEKGSIRFGCRVEGAYIYFYVSDTGAGIAVEKLEQIFSRFVQLKGAKQGIGLGLAICKGLVNRMGGDISVTSEEGVGSTFTFSLPLKK